MARFRNDGYRYDTKSGQYLDSHDNSREDAQIRARSGLGMHDSLGRQFDQLHQQFAAQVTTPRKVGAVSRLFGGQRRENARAVRAQQTLNQYR